MTDKTPAKVDENKTVRKRRSYKRARRLRFKIDTLPPEASHAIKRVQERLREGRDTQQMILFDLHSDLIALGIKTKISKSSMSNYAKWFAAQGHEIMAIRNFADIIAERVDTVEGSNVELYIGELIKAGVAKAVKAMLDDEKPDMTALRDAATALYRLARARETSLESRRLILKEVGERVDEIGKERGLSAKSIKDFKSMLRIPTKDGETEEPENDQ